MPASIDAVVGGANLGGDAAKIKCSDAIAKAQLLIVQEILKDSTKSQKGLDAVATTFGALDPSCVDDGAKAAIKATKDIPKACGALAGSAVGSCDPLPGCVIDRSVNAGQIMAHALYRTTPSLGRSCSVDADCASRACDTVVGIPVNQCVSFSCRDGIKDGNEGDVDCGFDCGGCAAGQTCNVGLDCESGNCSGGICQPFCTMTSDCSAGQVCTPWFTTGRNQCVPDTCSNGVIDMFEFDVDCGLSCNGCAAGTSCALDIGCASLDCSAGVCQ
jgi:hypothetical protein